MREGVREGVREGAREGVYGLVCLLQGRHGRSMLAVNSVYNWQCIQRRCRLSRLSRKSIPVGS